MSRYASLTGGTGDVNPQYFNMNGSTVATGSGVSNSFPTPIPRIPTKSGKALVMEILGASYYYFTGGLLSGIPDTSKAVTIYVTTKNPGTTSPGNLGVDGSVLDAVIAESNETTTGAVYQVWPIQRTFQDGAGHGVLVATDTIYMLFLNQSGATAGVQCRLLYRFKEINTTEFIGIVQSQT